MPGRGPRAQHHHWTQDQADQHDLGGTLVTLYSGSVPVSGGQTVPVTDTAGNPVLLPSGAHCFGEETDTGGADASSVDYDSYDNAAIVEKGDELGTLTITAANTFNTPLVPPPPGSFGNWGTMPVIGFPAGQWVLIGFALFALGAGLVSATRRRHLR